MKLLAVNNEDFHLIIRQLPDIIYKINKKGCFTFLNERISLLGYNPVELLGKHFSTIIPKEYVSMVSREKVLSNYIGKKTGDINAPKLFDERRTRDRRTQNLELELVHKYKKNEQGELRRFYTIISAEGLWKPGKKEGEKEFFGTLGIIRDISEKKTQEEKDLHINTLLKVIKDVHNVLNKGHDIKEIGISICELLINTHLYKDIYFALLNEKENRILPVMFNGNSLNKKWSISLDGNGTAPPCVEYVLSTSDKFIDILQLDVCSECEYCDHKIKHNALILRLSYKEKVFGVIVILIENMKVMYEEEISLLEEIVHGVSFTYSKYRTETHLQANEEKYRNLVENINEGIWVIDKVYNTTFVNLKITEMLDYSREELIGKPILKFINNKDKRNFWIYLKQCIMGVKKKYDCRFNCKHGKGIYALVDAIPVINKDGIYNGLIVGIVDITKRKQIERSLLKKNRMLSRFNNIAVHRELKMIELKKEINSLLSVLEKESKYHVEIDK